jgi:hypothetical protein
MSGIDWLPRNHEKLYNQVNQTWSYLENPVNLTRMGLDGKQALWINTEFNTARILFVEAFDAWKDESTRTMRIFEHLKEVEGKFRPLYRSLYKGFLKSNPFITNEDLVAMGLPVRHEGRSSDSPSVQSLVPSFLLKAGHLGVVIIHFWAGDNKNRTKPKKIHGVEICWEILAETPKDWRQLTNSSFSTRRPYHLTFDGYQRGKKVYCALRWENTRGEKGPWSIIQEAIIP